MQKVGVQQASGQLGIRVIGDRKIGLGWKIRNFPNLWRGLWKVWLAKLFGIPTHVGTLSIRLIRGPGDVVDYGVVGMRVITTAWVNFLIDNLVSDTTEFGDLKFHDAGEDSTAEAVGDTVMITPWGGARVTGSQEEDAANIYKSIGTITFDGSYVLREHGVFTIVTGGTLCDRTMHAIISVENGNQVEYTYKYTATAGS